MKLLGRVVVGVAAVPVCLVGGKAALMAVAGLVMLIALVLWPVEAWLRERARKRADQESIRQHEEEAKRKGYVYIG